jgi:hypothetical protein
MDAADEIGIGFVNTVAGEANKGGCESDHGRVRTIEM